MSNIKYKILCVEDEVDIRENISEILRDEGYDIYEADNGKNGFEKFLKINPDLVISDIKMPQLDGYDFLKLVRENKNVRNNATPFIFLSALGGKDNVIKGVELSANDYLLKPVDFDLLMAKVKEKISNIGRVNERHQRIMKRLKNQVAVVLPSDIFAYLDVIGQTAKALQDEPYGPLPHCGYHQDFSKIYLNSLKIRAVINNAVDEQLIDDRINANEDVYNCFDLLEEFIGALNPAIAKRIEIDDVHGKNFLPMVKCDNLVIFEALRKILAGILTINDSCKVAISIVHDNRNQIAIIFYYLSAHENSPEIDLEKYVNCYEIQKILDKQSCRFEIGQNREDTAVLSIPAHRVIINSN
ncbi:MAG: response regulator transcription factor [Alphaproteobacteria bacterium]